MKKVLILGAGLVAKPMVEYLMANGYRIVIASPMKGRADEMIADNPLGASIDWSMDDPETLGLMIAGNDITVSLLPYKYHPAVARICLQHQKHLVTTSYVKEEMQSLDEAAKNAGVLLLNEVGLDPGIDHMSAMKLIDYVHERSGKVEEFYSICGALPAPEAADNPMRYKFTWSPKGVILASLSNAVYLLKGQKVSIASEDLFNSPAKLDFPGIGTLDFYPNRDSISYSDIYGIPEAKTVYRGTFRYPGWCETIDAMKKLKMLDDEIRDYTSRSYADFLAERSGAGIKNLRKDISGFLKAGDDSPAIRSLEYLGFFSDEKLRYYETTPFEITSDRMVEKMMIGDNERDMVILQHMVLAAWPDGKKEVIRSSMIDYGTPATNTAIARTVALPASIAVSLILENKINLTGVHRPVLPEIYIPVLDELKKINIGMYEEHGLTEEYLPSV